MYVKVYISSMIAIVIDDKDDMVDSYHCKDPRDMRRFVCDWLGESITKEDNWLAYGEASVVYRPVIGLNATYAPGGLIAANLPAW